ncbi:Flp family type IVb pilin [Paeniroseomonas aquatica]|jgi:pilus assembly protein Flp/PilA|uniref:Flp family type IVb pilin n=1 Tax=Paeniroseomonas aquatica TaxID=373043 RepID=A0ABT8AEZ7_9PROT|nr:Flp family type IVb pilin [Paeniroseomonas aquatica]MDN3568402.1 Flp family type IVb pilin [Paeniroseomonas aquatica]
MNILSCYANARALIADRRGVTALEYGLIAALIAVVIIGGVTAVGNNAAAVFTGVATKLVAP